MLRIWRAFVHWLRPRTENFALRVQVDGAGTQVLRTRGKRGSFRIEIQQRDAGEYRGPYWVVEGYAGRYGKLTLTMSRGKFEGMDAVHLKRHTQR